MTKAAMANKDAMPTARLRKKNLARLAIWGLDSRVDMLSGARSGFTRLVKRIKAGIVGIHGAFNLETPGGPPAVPWGA